MSVQLPKGVEVARVAVTLYQESDTCDGGDGQALEVFTEDGAGGPFLVLKTERWSLDGDQIPGLVAAMEAVLAMAGKGMFAPDDAGDEGDEGDTTTTGRA